MILAVAALSLSLKIQPSSVDMMDGASIEIVAHNPDSRPQTVSFDTPNEYQIDITRGTTVVWSSLRPLPPGAHFPPHARSLMPGPTVLTVYIWNGLGSDGSAPGPGEYTIHARLLGGAHADAQATLKIINSAPVMAVQKLKEGDEVTIAGRLDPAKAALTDETGTMTLMKRLVTAPNGPVAVRGFLTTAPGGAKAFYVKRWAPLTPAVPLPEKTATPMSSPSPPVRRHF